MTLVGADAGIPGMHRGRLDSGLPLTVNRARFAPILVAVYIMANDSFFFFLSGPLTTVRRALLLLLPALLAIVYGVREMPPFVRRILAIAYATFLWAACATIITGDSFSGPVLLLQNFAPFLFLAAVAATSKSKETRVAIMRTVFWMGVVLSFQTIVLFLMFFTNRLPSSTVIVLAGSRKLKELNFGVWGFANGVLARNSAFTVYRAQSWFGEPSTFALFLEATVAFGVVSLPTATRRVVHKVGLGLTVIAMVLTFSTALSLTSIAAVTAFAISRMTKRSDRITRSVLMAAVIVGGLSVTPLAVNMLNDFYSAGHGRLSIAFGKSPVSSDTRQRATIETLNYVLDHPVGTGFTPLTELRASNDDVVSEPPGSAPMYWLLVLGLPGVAFLVLFVGGIVIGLATPALVASGAVQVLGVSLLAQTIHQVSAGSFTNGTFLLTIALLSWEASDADRADTHRRTHFDASPRARRFTVRAV